MRSRTRAGIEGTIRITGPGGASWTAASAPTGWFRAEELPRGANVDLEFSAPGCVPRREAGVRVLCGGDTDVGEIVLGEAIAVEVIVTGASGRPVPGAAVEVRRSAGYDDSLFGRVNPVEGRAVPGADGRAVIPGLAPGDWIVEAAAPGHSRERRPLALVEGARRAPLRIVLTPACSLSGRVLDDGGNPVPGVVVVALRARWWMEEGASRGEATSAPDGAYRIESLGAGPHEVVVRWPRGLVEGAGSVEVAGGTSHDVRLPPRASVRGRVLEDATGKPLPGAGVRLDANSGDWNSQAAVRSETDVEGAFALEGLPALPKTDLHVALPGYIPFPDARTPRPPPPGALEPGAVREAEIRLRAGSSIRGTVRDREGRPVAGAWVYAFSRVRGREDAFGASVRSDGEGRYLVDAAEPGTIFFSAGARNLHLPGGGRGTRDAADGDSPAEECSVLVPEAGTVEKDLVLVPDCRVEGRMVHRDGSPAPGIVPTLLKSGNREEWEVGTGIPSAPDGSFVIDDMAPDPGSYRIAAAAPEGRLGVSDPFELSESGTVKGVVVTVDSPGSLEGRVRRADGKLLEGAKVRLVPGDAHPERSWEWDRALEDAPPFPVEDDGTFRQEDLAPGKWTPVASAPGCITTHGETVNLADGERKSGIEIVLPQGWAISGVVVDGEGAPVVGAKVRAVEHWEEPREGEDSAVMSSRYLEEDSESSTDAKGAFRIEGLAEGRFDVTARATGRLSATVAAAAGGSDLRIVLLPGLSISGKVVAAGTGKPLPGVEVEVEGGPEYPEGEFCSGADGTFTVAGIREGTYTLRVGNQFPNEGQEWASKTVARVRAGTRDLVVALDPALSIEGRAVDAAGRPFDPRGMEIEIEPAGPDARWSTTGGIDPDGGFRYDGLAAGRYRITIRSSNWNGPGVYVARSVETGAGTRDVVLSLVRGKAITGKVVAADGSPPGKRVWIRAWPSGGRGDGGTPSDEMAKEDGTFAVGPFEEGVPRDLEAHGDDESLSGSVRDVQPGTAGVVLRLEKGASIAGRVVSPEGTSVAGAQVWVRPTAGDPVWIRATTDAEGRFSLDGLPARSFRVYAWSGDANLAPVEPASAVVPGAEGVVVKTAAGHEFRVRIREADGSPPAEEEHASVEITWSGRSETFPVDMREGVCVVRGLPACTVRLLVSWDGEMEDGEAAVAGTFTVPCPEQTVTLPAKE